MLQEQTLIPCRHACEWTFHSRYAYQNPFIDVTLDVVFLDPDGKEWVTPAFYDGDGTWRVRFTPRQAGTWSFAGRPLPSDVELARTGQFDVTSDSASGTLCNVPGKGWGFEYESGKPAYLLGDTVYNLFGAAHCGLDVASFLKRRAAQGINLLRVRLPVSPFHPPQGYSHWQTRRTWPWGGSERPRALTSSTWITSIPWMRSSLRLKTWVWVSR